MIDDCQGVSNAVAADTSCQDFSETVLLIILSDSSLSLSARLCEEMCVCVLCSHCVGNISLRVVPYKASNGTEHADRGLIQTERRL